LCIQAEINPYIESSPSPRLETRFTSTLNQFEIALTRRSFTSLLTPWATNSRLLRVTTGVRHTFFYLTPGFHVLRVVVNSAAANAGIEPWFDYICGVNSTKIVRVYEQFNTDLRTNLMHIYLGRQ
jgi:hypothetical protein